MTDKQASTTAGALVLAEVRDHVLWLTINREQARNALNDAVIVALTDGFDRARKDETLRAIVVTGAGARAFCAGGDLKTGSATFEFDYSQPSTTYADLMRAMHSSNLPTIARVNGHCLAGGMGLLAMCDMAIRKYTATTNVINMDITYIADKPRNLTQQQKQYFQKLLLLQGQVDNPSLAKINTCPFLCLAYDNEIPIGIGAIKQVYKTPFDKAEVPELKNNYDIELGYLYVLDKNKYRGKGIAKSICSELLNKVKLENVFATTEENDENAMKWILQKIGFKKTGKTYQGNKTKKNIGLYILTIADTTITCS